MKIGYARISTDTQVLDQQIDALLKYGVDERNIYKEQVTTRAKHRPELDRVLDYLKEGDTLVVCKLDRLGRSLAHLLSLMEFFIKNKINFISLTEAIDTTTANGILQFQIIASFAEFERNVISDRTREALAAIKKRGRKLGRPFILTLEQKEAINKFYEEGMPILRISKMINIKSTTPIYRYLKELNVSDFKREKKRVYHNEYTRPKIETFKENYNT